MNWLKSGWNVANGINKAFRHAWWNVKDFFSDLTIQEASRRQELEGLSTKIGDIPADILADPISMGKRILKFGGDKLGGYNSETIYTYNGHEFMDPNAVVKKGGFMYGMGKIKNFFENIGRVNKIPYAPRNILDSIIDNTNYNSIPAIVLPNAPGNYNSLEPIFNQDGSVRIGFDVDKMANPKEGVIVNAQGKFGETRRIAIAPENVAIDPEKWADSIGMDKGHNSWIMAQQGLKQVIDSPLKARYSKVASEWINQHDSHDPNLPNFYDYMDKLGQSPETVGDMEGHYQNFVNRYAGTYDSSKSIEQMDQDINYQQALQDVVKYKKLAEEAAVAHLNTDHQYKQVPDPNQSWYSRMWGGQKMISVRDTEKERALAQDVVRYNALFLNAQNIIDSYNSRNSAVVHPNPFGLSSSEMDKYG